VSKNFASLYIKQVSTAASPFTIPFSTWNVPFIIAISKFALIAIKTFVYENTPMRHALFLQSPHSYFYSAEKRNLKIQPILTLSVSQTLGLSKQV